MHFACCGQGTGEGLERWHAALKRHTSDPDSRYSVQARLGNAVDPGIEGLLTKKHEMNF